MCPICNCACSLSKLFVDPITDCLLAIHPLNDDVFIFSDGTFTAKSQSSAVSSSLLGQQNFSTCSSVSGKAPPIVIDLIDDDEDETATELVAPLPQIANQEMKRSSLAGLIVHIRDTLCGRYPRMGSDDLNSISLISKVRLTDILFFFNNAPKKPFLSMFNGVNLGAGCVGEVLYDKLVIAISYIMIFLFY